MFFFTKGRVIQHWGFQYQGLCLKSETSLFLNEIKLHAYGMKFSTYYRIHLKLSFKEKR